MRAPLWLCLLLFCLPAASQAMPGDGAKAAVEKNATHTTAYTLTPDELQKATALHRIRLSFELIGPIYSILVLLALLHFGVVARYRDWAKAVSCRRFLQAPIFMPLMLVTLGLLELPLSIYGHHVSLHYGLSVQRWGSWFADYCKGEAVNAVILTVVLWIGTTVIRLSPDRWWFYYWLITLPIQIFLVMIYPVVVDPMFNKFDPLSATHPALVESIERMAQKSHLDIPRDRIFEMKASEKVTVLNAYVTGFGPSKRVVVWDTTIQKMGEPETLSVVGHEMGHYVLHHIVKGLVLSAIGLFFFLYLIYRLAEPMLQRFGEQWKISQLGDWAALPMMIVIASVLGMLGEPIDNGVSRYFEHQADVYGLEVTHGINPDPQEAAAHAFEVLGETSLDYPNPSKLEVIWFYSHPPISDRVRFAHEYDPWGKGQEPMLVH